MRLLMVDAHDSFTHNLVQAFRALGARVEVVLADRVTARELATRPADAVVFGPGPGRPEDAGCVVDGVRTLAGRVPVLGVCLGHQAIGLAFGGRVIRHRVVHGHATPIHHDGTGLFQGLPPGVPMTRYHSLVVDPAALPPCLRVTAWSDDGAIQGLAHRRLPVHGVQFHPESVLSGEAGLRLLANFTGMATAQPRHRRRAAPATG